jgi:hypothetical protein
VLIYENGKMRPGMGRRKIKENGGGSIFNYDIFDLL